MSIWALADLHLSFGVPDKSMDVFGKQWIKHPEKIEANWRRLIQPEDLVLLPGDISWAMRPEDALKDLEWIEALPGTKVMLRGNHDYWWTSLSKIKKVMPPSIHLIQNDVFKWQNYVVCGARLWDTPEYSFGQFIDYIENPKENALTHVTDPKEAEKIFERELGRLEMSLKSLPRSNAIRIAMTHYPPIGHDLKTSRASALLEKYGIASCVFGHLHNVKHHSLPFGTKNGIRYALVSCDYLDFCPLQLV